MFGASGRTAPVLGCYTWITYSIELPHYRSACVVGGLLSVVLARSGLLVHDLDLLVDSPAGKPIDRYVHPVMLFPFDNKVSEIRFSRSVPPALRKHINQQSPSSGLCRVAEGPGYCFLWFLGAADGSTNSSCEAGKILPTNGLATIVTSWLRASRIRDQRGSWSRRARRNTSSWRWPNWQRPSQNG